jgi:hypothetical protein
MVVRVKWQPAPLRTAAPAAHTRTSEARRGVRGCRNRVSTVRTSIAVVSVGSDITRSRMGPHVTRACALHC